MNKFKEAIQHFDESLKIDKNDKTAWLFKGKCYFDIGDYELALKSFDEALKFDANNDEYLNSRAKCLLKLKQFDAAIESFDRALNINENNKFVWNSRGECLLETGNFTEAIDSFDKAIAIDNNYGLPWFWKGVAFRDKKQYNEAVQSFDESLKIDKNDESAFYLKGRCLVQLHKFAEAEKCFDSALSCNKEDKHYMDEKKNCISKLIQENKGFYDCSMNIPLSPYIIPPKDNKPFTFPDDMKDLCVDELMYKFVTSFTQTGKRLSGTDLVKQEMEKYNLKEEEFLSIYLYTANFEGKSIFSVMNSDIVSPNRKEGLIKWRRYLNVLLDGLCKLPQFTDDVPLYRGVDRDVTRTHPDKYRNHAEIIFYAFTSTSKKKDCSEEFVNQSPKGQSPKGTIFIIEKHFSGRCIQQFSSYPDEAEILFPTCSSFLITNIKHSPNVVEIFLNQIPSFEPDVFEKRIVKQ
eukprot:TRINITY_DN3790_c0_g1_i4.p1 TRINITY_DN3790_c0_g1~~TRINITY_DN3790_c0_g1_i4.p1  ORF type:complete len:462 (-),score=105.16 TRINITY_DN3790_c0_g1_i4:13-1398(-)